MRIMKYYSPLSGELLLPSNGSVVIVFVGLIISLSSLLVAVALTMEVADVGLMHVVSDTITNS